MQLGDAPGQILRIWLLNESKQQGVGISRPTVYTNGDLLCVQTDASFILWKGTADNSTFCDCYTRPGSGDNWNIETTYEGTCQP